MYGHVLLVRRLSLVALAPAVGLRPRLGLPELSALFIVHDMFDTPKCPRCKVDIQKIPARAVSFRSGLPVGFFLERHEKLKFQQISTLYSYLSRFSASSELFGIFFCPRFADSEISGSFSEFLPIFSPTRFSPPEMPPKKVPPQGKKATETEAQSGEHNTATTDDESRPSNKVEKVEREPRKTAKETHLESPNTKLSTKLAKVDEKQTRTRQSLLALQRKAPSIYDALGVNSQPPPDPFEPEEQQGQQTTSWADEVDQHEKAKGALLEDGEDALTSSAAPDPEAPQAHHATPTRAASRPPQRASHETPEGGLSQLNLPDIVQNSLNKDTAHEPGAQNDKPEDHQEEQAKDNEPHGDHQEQHVQDTGPDPTKRLEFDSPNPKNPQDPGQQEVHSSKKDVVGDKAPKSDTSGPKQTSKQESNQNPGSKPYGSDYTKVGPKSKPHECPLVHNANATTKPTLLAKWLVSPKLSNAPPSSTFTYHYVTGRSGENIEIGANLYAKLLPDVALRKLWELHPWSVHLGGDDLLVLNLLA